MDAQLGIYRLNSNEYSNVGYALNWSYPNLIAYNISSPLHDWVASNQEGVKIALGGGGIPVVSAQLSSKI